MAWPLIAAIAGGLAGGLVNSLVGGGKAISGLGKGLTQLTKLDEDIVAYIKTLAGPQEAFMAQGQQLAGFGQETLQTTLQALREQALNPTASPGFKLAAEEGLRQIANNFSTQGAPDSGPAQIAAGRFMTGLAANERDRQLQTLYNVAQVGANITGGGQATEAALGFGAQRGGLFGERVALNQNIAELFGLRGKAQAEQVAGITGAFTGALGGGQKGGGGLLSLFAK